MRRRRLLALTVGAVVAAPLDSRAQQAVKYRIGVLGNVPLSDPGGARLWGVFEEGLRDLGYENGRNIVLEHRSSEGHYERLPALAAELVRLKVDVIVAPAVQNVLAAQQATPITPVVMVSVGDPVGNKLVASLAHPGGNVTGTSFLASAVIGKQLELLKQLAPSATRHTVLVNPANPGHRLALDQARVAARSLGTQLDGFQARGPEDIERAFATLGREREGAVLVPWDGTFLVHLQKIVQLAAKARVPAMYGHRGYVDAGGLATYSPSAAAQMRSAASYVDRILRGAKPGVSPWSSRRSSSSSSTSRRQRRSGSRCRPPSWGGPTRSSSRPSFSRPSIPSRAVDPASGRSTYRGSRVWLRVPNTKGGPVNPAKTQIQPYLFFDGRCDEAVEFYRRAVGAEVLGLMRYKDSPDPGSAPRGMADKVMHGHIKIGGSDVMLSDGHAQGKPAFEGFALSLTVADETEADRFFGALSQDGTVQMPLTKTFFSPRFGMLTDRFGVMWMVYVPQ